MRNAQKKVGGDWMPAPPIGIHHIWVGGDFKPTRPQGEAMASWRRHFPDVRVRVWLDADAERLLAAYPARLRELYARLVPVAKADVLRYAIMHAHGGLYADLDYTCVAPFDVPDAPAAVQSNWLGAPDGDAVNNCLLSSPAAGDPLWGLVLRRLVEPRPVSRLGSVSATYAIIESTGPGFLRRVIAEHRAAGGRVDVFPQKLFNPCDDLCAVCDESGGDVLARHASAFSWGDGRMQRLKKAACALYPAARRAYPAARGGVGRLRRARPEVVAGWLALGLTAIWASKQLKSLGRSS
jgi:hypothetical protein